MEPRLVARVGVGAAGDTGPNWLVIGLGAAGIWLAYNVWEGYSAPATRKTASPSRPNRTVLMHNAFVGNSVGFRGHKIRVWERIYDDGRRPTYGAVIYRGKRKVGRTSGGYDGRSRAVAAAKNRIEFGSET